jgi:DMSO/TMAO reductase YedYZ molybdopterin-dependent catalytic subunit
MNPGEQGDLRVVTPAPLNAETRLERQVGTLTPVERHYVRNHFQVPAHPGALTIGGAVARPMRLTVEDLARRPATTATVTLECAGNGRRFLAPPAPGEQWGLGAVGTAEWTGVVLRDLLADVAPLAETVELVFGGADTGTPAALGREITFERSLPLPLGAAGSALVAYAMNGRPLTPDHGAPLRLIVPGWYGMASVKWLARITAVKEPFRGFFQVDRYVVDGRPIGPIAPRAVITSPVDGELVRKAASMIRGYAWSGHGPVELVEVSVDGGATWTAATLGTVAAPTAWRDWQLEWQPAVPGRVVVVARATDSAGAQQPLSQVWNELGYRNSAAQPLVVEVV